VRVACLSLHSDPETSDRSCILERRPCEPVTAILASVQPSRLLKAIVRTIGRDCHRPLESCGSSMDPRAPNLVELGRHIATVYLSWGRHFSDCSELLDNSRVRLGPRPSTGLSCFAKKTPRNFLNLTGNTPKDIRNMRGQQYPTVRVLIESNRG